MRTAAYLSLVVLAALGLATAAFAGSTHAAKAKWTCNYGQRGGSDRTVLFDNSNAYAVSDGGRPPSFKTKGKVWCLGYVQTYHWNGGAGQDPGPNGKITLQRTHGPKVAGIKFKTKITFPALGSPGQNGVQNANWYAYTPTSENVFIDGIYRCSDNGVTTWSYNKQSHGDGFCHVEVYPAVKG
ncbi:MAG TPA: hypothetical protein VKR79_06645 [Gaiellaceae bacterium]|nr:hypothetical protein [Gaiellaceae bacterium]